MELGVKSEEPKEVKRRATAVLAEIAPDACVKEHPHFFHPVTAALANL